jgi:hypothetical protein
MPSMGGGGGGRGAGGGGPAGGAPRGPGAVHQKKKNQKNIFYLKNFQSLPPPPPPPCNVPPRAHGLYQPPFKQAREVVVTLGIDAVEACIRSESSGSLFRVGAEHEVLGNALREFHPRGQYIIRDGRPETKEMFNVGLVHGWGMRYVI